jgi:hypothetical protein
MATFLTTPTMHPALRARVERAVSPRARARHHAGRAGLSGPFAAGGPRISWARIFPVALMVVLGALAYASYRAERRAVAAERASLLDTLAAQRARLPAGHEGFLAVTDRWIADVARDADPADMVSPALRGALDGWLRRPAAYVRLPVAEVRDAKAIDEAARASGKDAFLLCLLQPPPSASERDLLAKVRGTYFGGAKVDEETSSVRRLADAHVGLIALGPSFEGAVRAADDLPELRKLRRTLEGAPVAEAARASAAEVFLVVLDEGPTARVALVDLVHKNVLLRVRRPLEAPASSPAATVHREPLTACALALSVRNATNGPP